jgi:hypothetical protein
MDRDDYNRMIATLEGIAESLRIIAERQHRLMPKDDQPDRRLEPSTKHTRGK